jgi:hypothetical protein
MVLGCSITGAAVAGARVAGALTGGALVTGAGAAVLGAGADGVADLVGAAVAGAVPALVRAVAALLRRWSWQNGFSAGEDAAADETMMKQAKGAITGWVALAAQARAEA